MDRRAGPGRAVDADEVPRTRSGPVDERVVDSDDADSDGDDREEDPGDERGQGAEWTSDRFGRLDRPDRRGRRDRDGDGRALGSEVAAVPAVPPESTRRPVPARSGWASCRARPSAVVTSWVREFAPEAARSFRSLIHVGRLHFPNDVLPGLSVHGHGNQQNSLTRRNRCSAPRAREDRRCRAVPPAGHKSGSAARPTLSRRARRHFCPAGGTHSAPAVRAVNRFGCPRAPGHRREVVRTEAGSRTRRNPTRPADPSRRTDEAPDQEPCGCRRARRRDSGSR